MTGEVDLATIGSLLADRTRATFLLTLLNGGLTSASALADRAEVSRSLASSHLRKLVEGGLLAVEPRGRQRLYRLASQSIADALEVLILLAPPARVSTLRAANDRDNLRRGRLCYDHLAGRVGVALADQLVAAELLAPEADGYAVTAAGADAFATLEIDVAALADRSRPLTRACLDWSERRHHLAGSLGAALSGELLRRGWLETREASRIVTVTPAGRDALHDVFGLAPASLDLPHGDPVPTATAAA
jgi:DNA-binding transcriptional ArsR family regulator